METTTVGASAAVSRPSTERGVRSLSSEDFFRILVTEMQNQDPFSPNDTQDIIRNVSEIRSIELSTELTDTLAQLSERQHSAGLTSLLGKHVVSQRQDDSGGVVVEEGVVTGVEFADDGSAVLELDTGVAVRAEDVVRVSGAGGLKPGSVDSAGAPLVGETPADGSTAKARGGLWPWLSFDAKW